MTKAGHDAGPSRAGDGRDVDPTKTKFYLVGGGIASLAAAVFLIRDGAVPGQNITILEGLGKLGGSLDGVGPPRSGYFVHGGRMLDSKYVCTFDLLSSIPTLDGSTTVTQEIFAWNETLKTSSKPRFFRGGRRLDAPEHGLGEKDIRALERFVAAPEATLGNGRIADQFDPSFFTTDFWLMWSATFAFHKRHSAVEFKRHLLRFAHTVSGLNSRHGIMHTVYNEFDSMVRPLQNWLAGRGVRFELETHVTDLALREDAGVKRVERIAYECGERHGEIEVSLHDYVIVTLGSMTEGSSMGSPEFPAILKGKTEGGAWSLWEKIANGRPEFGQPSTFDGHIDESKWMSFTTTEHAPTFFGIVRDMTGSVSSEGGMMTFLDSSWLLSIVLPHQPFFIGQPDHVNVFWGYGLSIDKPGDFVKKPMSACNGKEIMVELLGHLRIEAHASRILETSICNPCLMPFITSQFLPRARGDRPHVVPDGWTNLGFIGQFCELPDDVAFTVEYSVRSAQAAVYSLLGLEREPPAVDTGSLDPRELYAAFESPHPSE